MIEGLKEQNANRHIETVISDRFGAIYVGLTKREKFAIEILKSVMQGALMALQYSTHPARIRSWKMEP